MRSPAASSPASSGVRVWLKVALAGTDALPMRPFRRLKLNKPLTALAAVAAMATALGPGVGAAHASAAVLVPGSIPTTCSASSPDVTAQLQSWVASVPDGSTIEFAANACYRVEGTLKFQDRNNLTFEGNGATLRSFTDGTGYVRNVQTRHHIFLYGGSNLVFNNLNIVGDNPTHHYSAAYAGQAGWWVWGTQGLTITNSTIQAVRGDFITLGPDTYRSWRWTNQVTITDDSFLASGRQGIAITGAQNVLIARNNIGQAALSQIDIEPDSGTGPDNQGVPTYGGAANITIDHNLFGYSGTTFLSNYGYCAEIADVSVTNNTLKNDSLIIWSKGCQNVHRTGWTIANNTSDRAFGSPRAAIEFTYVDGATVRGNVIPFYAPEKVTAVKLWGSSDISVLNNEFPGAATAVLVDPPGWKGTPSQDVTSSNNSLLPLNH